MSNSKTINLKINQDVKIKAEQVMEDFGTTPDSLIKRLFEEIAVTQAVPLSLKDSESKS